MSKSSLVTKNVGSIVTSSVKFVGKQSMTQGTSVSSTVTLDSPVGSIITFNNTLGTSASTAFTFANSYIQPGSLLFTTVQNYTGGTNGNHKVSVNAVGSSYATINVSNTSTTSAMNGALTIGYMVV